MKLYLFNIASFKIDGGAMFGVVPKLLWSRVYPSDADNLITLTLRSLLIDTGDRKILVDTGWGDKQDERYFRHVHLHGGEGLTGGLKARGYDSSDITDVILTHLHADHCGGAVKSDGKGGYELQFPNAVHHVSKTQWEWAVKNNRREEDSYPRENIIPIGESGKLNLIEQEAVLTRGVSIIFCNGHTPGLMLPVIDYNGRKLFYTGDLIPTSAHIPLIWNMSYDIESLKTIDEKSRLLAEAEANNGVLVFQHDENIECCSVHNTPKGIRMMEKLSFQEILM
jgi:glyoxylase-like metal-dependent hydrolase (beta-lactamase superfamily II)